MTGRFDDVLKYPYVIIYDNANGHKLHKTSCSFVTEENYRLKVIINQRKNGYYRPVESLESTKDSSIKPCKVCIPIQP